MIRLITQSDSRLQENLHGDYELLLFQAVATPSISGTDLIFFKFGEEVSRNIEGNGYVAFDGYLYDRLNLTGNFLYTAESDRQIQTITCRNLRNLNITFYNKDGTTITIPEWSMLIKKVK